MLSGPAGITRSSSQFRLKYPNTRSKVPSAFRIHPSKYGTTFWPLLNLVDGSSVGSCPVCPAASKGCPAYAARATSATAANVVFLFIRLRLSRVEPLFVLRIVDVEQADPGEAHLVDRALAVANPVARVRVVLVGRRVVVPRGHVDDRSRRQNRRDFVGVRIGDVPAELVVADAVDRFGARRPGTRRVGADVGVNRFHAHRLAAIVHVRLEG